jgi:hypothetical protein
LVERVQREEKVTKKQAQSKAQIKRMVRGQEFVEVLHNFWGKCSTHSPSGSAGCYVCPRTAKHLPLTHKVSTLWAIKHVSGYT